MFKARLLSAVAALAMTLGAAGAGHADIINWTIENGVFSDGGTLSGTFSIDTTDESIVDYDVVSTPGTNGAGTGLLAPLPTQYGTEYSTSNPNMTIWTAGRGYPVLADTVYNYPDGFNGLDWELDLNSVPYPGSGTYSLAGDTEGLFEDGEFPQGPSRMLVSGVAVSGAVPEPATWAMLILGLGLIGVAARRRAKARPSRPEQSRQTSGGVGCLKCLCEPLWRTSRHPAASILAMTVRLSVCVFMRARRSGVQDRCVRVCMSRLGSGAA